MTLRWTAALLCWLGASTTVVSLAQAGEFGEVYVETSESDARIWLDGEDTGLDAPALLTELSPGKHTIHVKAKCTVGHETINVPAGEIVRLNVGLSLSPGSVSVTSEPSGASIMIGGMERGKTPLVVDSLMCGMHEVSVDYADHFAVVQEVEILADQEVKVSVALTRKLYGKLTLVPKPIHADVSLDAKVLGEGAFTIPKVLTGDHQIRMTAAGHRSGEAIVPVREDQTTRVEMTLVPKRGGQGMETSTVVLVDGQPLKNKEPEELAQAEAPPVEAIESPQAAPVDLEEPAAPAPTSTKQTASSEKKSKTPKPKKQGEAAVEEPAPTKERAAKPKQRGKDTPEPTPAVSVAEVPKPAPKTKVRSGGNQKGAKIGIGLSLLGGGMALGGYGTWQYLQAKTAYNDFLVQSDMSVADEIYEGDVRPRTTTAIVSYSIGGLLVLASIPCWATLGGQVAVHPTGVTWTHRW